MTTTAVLLAIWSLGIQMDAQAADDPVRSGYATVHDGSQIYFEVHGDGPKTLFLGPGTTTARLSFPPGISVPDEMLDFLRATRRAFIDRLGDHYQLILSDYPGAEPKMYTLTPGAVARDFLAIADAAGVERFAYYGYSWGCVTGLQLALRSDRLEALVCGGFPVMDGPYDDMLKITKLAAESSLHAGSLGEAPESGRQFLTFYEGLQSFDDRAIHGQLTIPRLNWIGSEDIIRMGGEIETNMAQTVVDNREALERAGWGVLIVEGHDHGTAMAPDIALPLIRQWLDENWR